MERRSILEILNTDPVITEVYQYFRKELGMLPPPYDLWGGYSVDEYREYLVECKKQKRNDVKWKYSIELPPIEEWRRIKNTPSRKWAGCCMRKTRWFWISRREYKMKQKN